MDDQDIDIEMMDTDVSACYSFRGETFYYPIAIEYDPQAVGLEKDLEAMSIESSAQAKTNQAFSSPSEQRYLKFGKALEVEELANRDHYLYSECKNDPERISYPPESTLEGETIDRERVVINIFGEGCANPLHETTVLPGGTRTIGKVALSSGEVIEPAEIRFAESLLLTEEEYRQNAHDCFECLNRTCTQDRRPLVSDTDYRVVTMAFLTKEKDQPETTVHVDIAIVKGDSYGYQCDWEVQCIGDRQVATFPENWEPDLPVSKVYFDTLDDDPRGIYDTRTGTYSILLDNVTRPSDSKPGMAMVRHVVPYEQG